MMQISSLLRIENKHLLVDIFPKGGGKLTSIYNKELGCEFLWRNEALNLQSYATGTEYDPAFYGGVDELLPNDIPENVDGMEFPDHGELWTQSLTASFMDNCVTLKGLLPVSKLNYQKSIRLDDNGPFIHTSYIITNENTQPVKFLWKLHAALKIKEGDHVLCSAGKGQVVDPEYSRYKQTTPFEWPLLEQNDVSLVPPENDTMDFYYLYELGNGEVGLATKEGTYFGYRFDKQVFPYVWLFASYGGFLNHYTAILEPCTTMPVSVNDAARLGQTMILQPGESMSTQVTIIADSLTNTTKNK
ncbi:hypothetical protein [Maribellus sp. YY47]|uniref:hypothetical protein n=1 Tax=Maribellus sp. YY47 TaxID=2929486 RepID=UPI002001112F|nr:hypothetical protein [Maribellus sp. YY47]MCK3685581.1 hypothetical protein [Maribellus sp. YY47]